MLIKLTMKTMDITYLVDFTGDTKLSKVRQEASERFKIPEAAIKLTANGQPLNLSESVCVQLHENDSVFVELDEENFKSNEMQQRKDNLVQKLQSSNDVKQLHQFYENNQKLIQPFLLSAQDKLRQSLKIIKFVDELKKAETVDLNTIDKAKFAEQIHKGDVEHEKDIQQYFPQSYLTSYLETDYFLEGRNEIEAAKQELNEVAKNQPLALMGTAPLRPLSLKGPESDYYELAELEKQNITTVLVETLFSQIAVMYFLLEEILKQMEGRTFNDYQEKDRVEDMKHISMTCVYNLFELVDVKDLLLGQYIDRKRSFDKEKINQGYSAYIDGLRKAYKDELNLVKYYGIPVSDDEILQRLEKNGGDSQTTINELLKEQDEKEKKDKK